VREILKYYTHHPRRKQTSKSDTARMQAQAQALASPFVSAGSIRGRLQPY